MKLDHHTALDYRRVGEWHITATTVHDPRPARMPPRRVGLSFFVAEEAAEAVAPKLPAMQRGIDIAVEARARELQRIRFAWPLVRRIRRLRGAA